MISRPLLVSGGSLSPPVIVNNIIEHRVSKIECARRTLQDNLHIMSPTKFTRRKVSSLAQLSGSKAPTEQPLSPKSGQKRKLQPELKDRAEAFLNAASRSTSTPSTPTKKPIKRRKMSAKEATIDIKSVDTPGAHKTNSPKRSSKKAQSDKGSPSKNSSPEKRPRTTRKKPPLSYLEKLERAQTQRMIVIDRVRKDTEACPVEDISVVGTTGNVYKVCAFSATS